MEYGDVGRIAITGGGTTIESERGSFIAFGFRPGMIAKMTAVPRIGMLWRIVTAVRRAFQAPLSRSNDCLWFPIRAVEQHKIVLPAGYLSEQRATREFRITTATFYMKPTPRHKERLTIEEFE